MSEQNVYAELVGFLAADRADLQAKAAEAALTVTDRDGMANLVRHGAVKPLCKLASMPGGTAINALSTLVNLSSGTSSDQCVEDMIDCRGTSRMAEIALTSPPPPADVDAMDEWRRKINFALALVANMTRTERGAVEFCGRSMPDEAIPSAAATGGGGGAAAGAAQANMEGVMKPAKPTLTLLLSRFLLPSLVKASQDEQNDSATAEEVGGRHDDPYQHFAAVLMNATQIEQGRKFVMKLQRNKSGEAAPTSVLQSILPQLRSTNPVRRRGVAGTVKNCCFDADSSWWLLNEVGIVRHLLYPLAGPEELDPDDKVGLDPDLWLEGPDKVREPDRVARLLLVESILLLCASGRKSREFIRAQKTYVILKMADMMEESEDVNASINECVQYLRRDEEGCEEGSSDRKADEAFRGARERLALPAPSPAIDMRPASDDLDDVD